MATARTSKNLANRERARERRLTLQAEQIKRDQLIDEHTADFLDLVDQREAIRADLAAFDAKLATKLAALISDGGLSARDAQALLEIDAAEVKRLRSLASAHEAPTLPTASPAHNGEPTRAE